MSEKKFLHKKIEVTRFELATPWSQTRCSTKLSHTSEFLPLRKGTSLYYPKSEYFVNRIFRILIIKILKLFRKMEVEDWVLPPAFLLQLFLRNSLSNSFYQSISTKSASRNGVDVIYSISALSC